MNEPKNYDYNSGKMPSLDLFGVDQLPSEARKDVIEWHESDQKRLDETGNKVLF
jgi:hypothetical protein